MKRHAIEYVGILAGSLVLALTVSWTSLGTQIDNDAYGWMFRLYHPAPREPQSMILEIDERSLKESGGMRGIRRALAEGLERLTPVGPRAIAIDVILADETGDVADDARLAKAIGAAKRVVLACDLTPDGKSWEDPLPRFRNAAAGTGHVHAEPDPISREIVLEKVAGRDRRWALALEAFRTGTGDTVLETLDDIQVGGVTIPAARPWRTILIRYLPPDRAVPRISLAQMRQNPGIAKRVAGKTVFLGLTVQSAFRDRLLTPFSNRVYMAGVEINANVFETIAQQTFLLPVPAWATVAICILLVASVGASFSLLSGWKSYAAGSVLLTFAHVLPFICFQYSAVLPFTSPVFASWLAMSVAASYQHFVVRHRMLRAEVEKLRYQQAMHFVTHEMRTPLTAIQGSSELIGRYKMPEEKQKQMAQLINSESKRLGRMIEIFLSVERLSAGQLELKKEQFSGMDLMSACAERVRPLAERKEITIRIDTACDSTVTGDRELMEYAFYNLLTNAVKYSPPSTEVSVFGRHESERIRISVQDQGI
ncbi:MAG: CHASE2 domain-containing protein, partial [Bryobacteraceae bacterium]